MRDSYLFGTSRVMHLLLGFFIALIVGLPAGEAVGTAFVFAGVLRLVAAPFYLAGRHVHSRYFRLLLVGAVPGLVVGITALRLLAKPGSDPVVVIVLGLILALTSSLTFLPRISNPGFAQKNSRWLPWLAFQIGLEPEFFSTA